MAGPGATPISERVSTPLFWIQLRSNGTIRYEISKSGKVSVNGAQTGDAVAELGAERVEGLLPAGRQLACVILDRVVQEHGAGQVGTGGRLTAALIELRQPRPYGQITEVNFATRNRLATSASCRGARPEPPIGARDGFFADHWPGRPDQVDLAFAALVLLWKVGSCVCRRSALHRRLRAGLRSFLPG